MVLAILASLEDTMSILTRPRPPSSDLPTDPEALEALIEEARQRARRRRRGYAACALVAASAALLVYFGINHGGGATRGQARAEQPRVGAQDAFARARGWITFRKGAQIIAVDPANPTNTVVLRRLLNAEDPIAWTSDGTKLLLRSELELEGTIHAPLPGLFILHADGSRTTVLPETESWGRGPPTWGSFSPDGTEVAYARNGSSRGPYIAASNGGKQYPLGHRCPRKKISGKLVEVCGEPLWEAAAWSPDGSRIAWVDFVEDSAKYGHHATVLSFVNPDGTGLREEVARLPGGGGNLVWSPDGSRLAFWGPSQIFVINADGSGLRQVTDEGVNRWPTWSPDGSRIAFVHDGALYTMAPDGTATRRLDGVRPDGAIAWNPVG
jgi:Tol biopolymer transport system component